MLAPAIARDEGWSAAAIFSAYSAALLVQGLVSLPVGMLVDRAGGRAVMTAGAVLSAASLALVSIAPTAPFVLRRVVRGRAGDGGNTIRARLRHA
ncbi:MAG: hypothetical protein RML45_09295 [Acetobacteraceae bacterium]|nr:hypothetical protein [Acetobacteraceae bacterium]